MFIEKKIETVLKTAIAAAVSPLLSGAVTVRTFWAEDAHAAGDELASLPMVIIGCSPVSRPTGHESERVASVLFMCATHFNDDYDRADLALIYETVRDIVETTAFDFGGEIEYTADSYNIESIGSIEINDGLQSVDFAVDFHICAGDFVWVE